MGNERMDLVVDANVLFAVLIKDGATIDILLDIDARLFVPEFVFEELLEHRKEILGKTKRSEGELNDVLDTLRSLLTTVPKEDFIEYMNRALDISPDSDDAPYMALRLGLPIWSNDKRLKSQATVEILSTSEIITRFDKRIKLA